MQARNWKIISCIHKETGHDDSELSHILYCSSLIGAIPLCYISLILY